MLATHGRASPKRDREQLCPGWLRHTIWFGCTTGPCVSSYKTRQCNVLGISASFSQPSRQLMAKDYQRLRKDVANANGEGKAVRILAGIVLDKEGRAFISNLERNVAELCTEILDHVNRECGSRTVPARDDVRMDGPR